MRDTVAPDDANEWATNMPQPPFETERDTGRFARAFALIDRWVAKGALPAASAAVGHSAGLLACHSVAAAQSPRDDAAHEPRGAKPGDGGLRPAPPEPIYLIASPTKPITALAVMLLAEEGELKLVDTVAHFVPQFAAAGKRAITLVHCLTHTSGLPDMLPENLALRAAQAPLEEFVRGACAVRPEFTPGTRVQYQSMGFLMLGEVVRQVSGLPLAEFLARRVFAPLAMHDTALGMPPAWSAAGPAGEPPRVARIAPVAESEVPGEAAIWNSEYWRRLGAPWGGLLSTATDLGRLYTELLAVHRGTGTLLSRAALTAMTSNQLVHQPQVPETDRRAQPWGYGWQLNWPAHPTSLGDLLSPAAYGHWGATGTLVWLDPQRDAYTVLLTTAPLPSGRRLHSNFSNTVCAALE